MGRTVHTTIVRRDIQLRVLVIWRLKPKLNLFRIVLEEAFGKRLSFRSVYQEFGYAYPSMFDLLFNRPARHGVPDFYVGRPVGGSRTPIARRALRYRY